MHAGLQVCAEAVSIPSAASSWAACIGHDSGWLWQASLHSCAASSDCVCMGQLPDAMHSAEHWCSTISVACPASSPWASPPTEMKGAIIKATMEVNLIKMFIEGPEVSLKGSPTVSPVTEALWASDPLYSILPSMLTPFSKDFFALSQAPPALF